MRYAFILNPAAKKGKNRKGVARMEEAINRWHPDATIAFSTARGGIKVLAKRLGESHDVVIVCGGDGSLSELVAGLDGTSCAGGLIPSGSGNDFARSIGLSNNPFVEIQQIATREIREIDIVRTEMDGHPCLFQNTLGIGLDGWANHYASLLRGPMGTMHYLLAALKAIMSHRPQHYELWMDGVYERTEAVMITLANGGVEGGGFHVAPEALPDDGLLDVVIIPTMGTLGLLLRLPFLLFRRQPKLKSIIRRRCSRVRVLSRQPMAVHADGECMGLGIRELRAQVEYRALRFLLPVAAASKIS